MSQKIQFVERATKGEPIAALCREFGISRTTGHKWAKRYAEHGYDGLEEESRRPKSAPLATAEDIVVALLELRRAHPTWGPEKLVILLRRRFKEQTPSRRTVARILRRAQLVRQRRKRRPLNIVERAPQQQATAPNEVWTVDFKGWWRARNRELCQPLTVRDAFSRFVLACVLCSTTAAEVRKIFERLFTSHGVPSAIQCDNGIPFVSVQSPAGLSVLSAWWVSLGIRIVRSRLSCPQDNGAHERMHRDISEAMQHSPASTAGEQQRLLQKWKQEFNHVRPHQALDGKTPAEVYKSLPASLPPRAADLGPAGCREVRIDRNGCFKLRKEKYFLTTSLNGFSVALETIDAFHVRAWFHGIDIGTVEIEPVLDDSVYLERKHRAHGKVA